MKYKVGDLIKFKSEKQRYRIRACDERFIIATKPYNPKRTFLYTIIDLEKEIRGADNWYCKFNYVNEKEAEKCLPLLHLDPLKNHGSVEISHRRSMKLDLERIDSV
jgi:hypothetical protein